MNKNYALDLVDERDYQVEELLGKVENLPNKIFLADDEIQNQRYKDPYGCVFYTWSSISNTMNYLAWEPERISGHRLSQIAIQKWLLNPEKGAYIISSPKLLKELGYITWFARCRSLQDIKLSLYHKKPVQTGSNTISWSKTKKNNNIAVKGSSYGHSFFICWYDDEKELLKCENSYWPEEYDHWYFYIKYSDLNLLYLSKYVMTDKPNAETLYKEKIKANIDLELAKKGFELWLWNWLNPKQSASRQEVIVMIMRALEIQKK